MFITSESGSVLSLLVVLAAVVVSGCHATPEPEAGEASPRSSGAASRGELLSFACLACHSFESGGQHQVGPNLHGVFGRIAGSAPGFDYSDALRDSGIIWSPEALDRWLADPTGFLPGTSMAFTGYQDPADRRMLIDYLVAVAGP